jgi:hypothetical protein
MIRSASIVESCAFLALGFRRASPSALTYRDGNAPAFQAQQ